MKNAFVYLFTFIVAFTLTLSCSGDDDGGGNNTPKSDAKAITSFKFEVNQNDGLSENINATINENDKTITAAMPYGTDITSLVPAIEVSPKATFSSEGKQDFSTGVIYTVTAEDGTKAQYTVTVTIAPNTEAKIISFTFLAENNAALEEDTTAIIDEEAKTITAYVAYGTDITELTPTLEVSPEASFTPEGTQDFSSEVVYTVTAGDESTKADYTINVIESSNSDAKILSFAFLAENNLALEEDITATIDENSKTINAEVPYGTDITALITSVDVSPGATFIPEDPQDFSSEITYTVTAQDGTKADYIVSVTVTPNNEAQLLSFVFLTENNPALEVDVTATIDEDTKTISALVPHDTDITDLIPTIEVSPNATVSPEGTQDFSSEVVYTVTAQNGTTTDYTITVYIINPQRAALIAIYNANPGNTLEWNLEDPDIDNWQGVTTDESGNVTELDLDSNELTSIPAEIGQLANLEYLSLYENYLTSLPSEIGQLNSLEYLGLYYNRLTFIPVEVGQLVKLEHLNLKKNQLTSVPTEIGQLSSLKYLSLSENNLTTFPSEIGQASSLEILGLSYNQLTSAPAEIGQLANLQMLYLDNNQLISLPAEIGQLANLTSLNLYNNQLSSIPSEIGLTSNLTELNLSVNQLTSIPVEIGQLANLEHLRLDNNQLPSVPAEIGQLSNLTELNLAVNQLTSVPVEIGQLSNLTELSLSGNQLTAVPAEIGQLSNLVWLALSTNQLTSIPVEIKQLVKLKTLYLSYNQLTSIPAEIGQLTNLVLLSLSNNQFPSIPIEVRKLIRLQTLYLSNNQLTSIPAEIGQLANLSYLHLNDNQLTSIPAEIGQLANLNWLDLSYNQLTFIPQEVCDLETNHGTSIQADEGVTCE